MFNKEEIVSVLNLLSREGIKIDITEAQAVVVLKNRFMQELMKLEKASEVTSSDNKAVDNSPIIGSKKSTK